MQDIASSDIASPMTCSTVPLVRGPNPGTSPACVEACEGKQSWRFSDLIRLEDIAPRWNRVKGYFYLRESTYDMTSRCNLQCNGCYYYEGTKHRVSDVADQSAWRDLMRAEKARGITYVVLAGAEPALVPDLLQACYDEIPRGCVASNGSRRIPDRVGYRIHISVWGNDDTSWRTRRAKDLLGRQITNYAGDPRAVFVYTFTRENIDEAGEVIAALARAGCPSTFNVFSAPVGYNGPLRHDRDSLQRTQRMMLDLVERHPNHVLFSSYSAVVHTHSRSLHDLFSCPYPRVNASTDVGLGRSFRQVRADLSWVREASCCVPDTDCADCRHYAAGSAVVTSKLHRHASDPEHFRAWLDYVETYLSVWVMGYSRDVLPRRRLVAPPGMSLDRPEDV